MDCKKKYFKNLKWNPIHLENIDEKKLIHQFEEKTIEMNTEKLTGKYTVNEIR